MKKIVFFLITCLLYFSCSTASQKQQIKTSTSNRKIERVDSFKSCDDKLRELIVSSANFENPFKNQLKAKITEKNDEIFTIELYVEDSGVNSINTVGWIKLNTHEQSLIDITNDPDDGILLQYNKDLYNDYITRCLHINSDGKLIRQNDINYCKLPFDFNDYYNSGNTDKVNRIYPTYTYNPKDNLSKLVKRYFGVEYSYNEYLYLPPINSEQPIILCNTETDIETYDLVIVESNRIKSSLTIGHMDGNEIIDFTISSDYLITLYKYQDATVKRKKWKTFRFNKNGIFYEIP